MGSTYLSFRHHPPGAATVVIIVVVIIVAHHKNSPARQCRRTSTVLSTPSSSFRQRVSFCHPCRVLHRQPRLHGIVYLIRRVVVLFDLFPWTLAVISDKRRDN